jgi:hypothetical protein
VSGTGKLRCYKHLYTCQEKPEVGVGKYLTG